MARLPHPPSGVRFFGRVLAAVLECPKCGRVLHFNANGASWGGAWDRRTSELTCHGCQKVYVIGLLAWPVVRRSHSRTLPRDQVPSERELAQLRARGDGLWMERPVRAKREPDSNIGPACTCPPGKANTTGQDPHCPVHGDQ